MSYSDLVSTEVLFFINQLPWSYKNKIPKDFIDELYENYSEIIYKTFDPNKPFDKQTISDEAKSLIYEITIKYLDD